MEQKVNYSAKVKDFLLHLLLVAGSLFAGTFSSFLILREKDDLSIGWSLIFAIATAIQLPRKQSILCIVIYVLTVLIDPCSKWIQP